MTVTEYVKAVTEILKSPCPTCGDPIRDRQHRRVTDGDEVSFRCVSGHVFSRRFVVEVFMVGE